MGREIIIMARVRREGVGGNHPTWLRSGPPAASVQCTITHRFAHPEASEYGEIIDAGLAAGEAKRACGARKGSGTQGNDQATIVSKNSDFHE